MFNLVFLDGLHALFDIFLDEVDLYQPFQQFIVAKLHTIHIDQDGALNTPAARFLHPAPIAVGGIHDLGGWDDRNGLVEVLHLDGVQVDVDHIPVCIESRHLDPVSFLDQVHGVNLHARHQRKDGILKNEQQHSGHRSQPGQQRQGRFTGKEGNGQDDRHHDDQDAQDVQVALDGHPLVGRTAFIDFIQRIKQGGQCQRHQPQDAE